MSLTGDKFVEALKASFPSVLDKQISFGGVVTMVESEIMRRITGLSERYASWWNTSRGAVEAATSRLQSGLTAAAIKEGQQTASNDVASG